MAILAELRHYRAHYLAVAEGAAARSDRDGTAAALRCTTYFADELRIREAHQAPSLEWVNASIGRQV